MKIPKTLASVLFSPSHNRFRCICVFGKNEDENNKLLSFLKNGLNTLNQLTQGTNESSQSWKISTSPSGYKILSHMGVTKAEICILLIQHNDHKNFLHNELEKYLSFLNDKEIKNLIICINYTNHYEWPFHINHEIVCFTSGLLQKYNISKFLTCPISNYLNIFQKHNMIWNQSSLYTKLDSFSIQNNEACGDCFYKKRDSDIDTDNDSDSDNDSDIDTDNDSDSDDSDIDTNTDKNAITHIKQLNGIQTHSEYQEFNPDFQ